MPLNRGKKKEEGNRFCKKCNLKKIITQEGKQERTNDDYRQHMAVRQHKYTPVGGIIHLFFLLLKLLFKQVMHFPAALQMEVCAHMPKIQIQQQQHKSVLHDSPFSYSYF